jgi:triacylglycerol esterase/lipase EstA (alpha/beta hydrolase family)
MSTPQLAGGFGKSYLQSACVKLRRKLINMAPPDAIGLSQGGLFMRDYVQRYNQPPVHNLLTVR